MSKLRFRISMSLDGFVAGPNQSVDNPIGVGGMRLHEWIFSLRFWNQMEGRPGGEVNESNRVVEESFANLGATIMGGNMFGGGTAHGTRRNRGVAGGAATRLTTTPYSCSRITRVRRSRWKAARRSISSPTASSRRSSRRAALVRTVPTPDVIHLKFARHT